jgi:hypothetical protein
MRETAPHDTGEEQPGSPPVGPAATGGGKSPGTTRRPGAPRLWAPVVIVAAAAGLVVVVLFTRGHSASPPATDRMPSQPALTVVPELTPTQAPPPSPSATPIPLALKKEIEDAFDRFWRVRADAAFRLDASRLPDVAAGAALEVERQNIEQLRAQGHAARFVVDLQYGVQQATGTTAVVASKYQERSYVIDAGTKQPLAPTPATAEVVTMTFWMEKIDGTWKVVDGAVHHS